MISTWAVLLLSVVGALCVDHDFIGKLPLRSRPHPSLNIINGNKTSVAKYPYIASLKQRGQEFGAAVILNKKWLLTTAWAVWVPNKDLKFRVGSSFYDKRGQVLEASKVVVHPKYSPFSWDYDIAVVKTDKPIKLGKNVKAIKLGTKSLKGGTTSWIAGWGSDTSSKATEHLMEAQVTVYNWKKCEQIFKEDLTKRLMCSLDEYVAPCGYDFADPLVVKGVLYGLYAGGHVCEPGAPALYTDVTSLYDWVQNTISGEEDDQE